MRRRDGFAKKDSQALLETRLSAMDAWDCKRARGIQDESPEAAVERNMFDEPRRPLAWVKEVVKEHAQ